MAKGADAFRSIGEVARLIGVAPHVLRHWETQFTALRPVKRGDGRRYYRPDDVRLAAGLCVLLREEGMAIRGARKILAADRGESVRLRGDARLAGAADAAPDMPAPAPAPAPAPTTTATPAPDRPRAAATDVPAADAPAPAAPPAPVPADAAPRRAATQTPPLPLFDAPAPARPSTRPWCARLAACAAQLRALAPADLPPEARPALARLMQGVIAPR